MAGRKPKPTAVKKLEGNPGKRKLNTKEPVPAKGMPDCPEWLLPEAKKEWERLADLIVVVKHFCTLMANKIGGLQFGIYRNCQISSRVFHTAVAALPLTKANRSDFE